MPARCVDDDRMTQRAIAVLLVLVAACSGDPDAASTPAAAVVPVTTQATTTSTTASTTTSTTLVPTTTTTTLPPLDRSAAATLERLHADLAVLLAMGPRVSGSPAEEATAAHFAYQASMITGRDSRIEPFTLPTGAISHNAWSSEVGRGDRLLIIGSHLDSVVGSPGADDNASGAILILELLRRLAEDPPTGIRVRVVGFGAEERIGGLGHHHGSRFAADRLEERDELPDLMLSVDMVGWGPAITSVSFRGHDTWFADELVLIGADAGIEITRQSRGEISDHVAFARAGVPAALFHRGGNPDYHQPGDDHVIDEILLENVRLLEAIIEHLSPPPPPPAPGAGAYQN
jgi:hypothetical protein